ncbi:MAG: hypothetical protein U0531_05690 [Dehalococcoidia bacterium]
MAIVNRSARQGVFVPRGAEPGLTRRFQWRDIDQDKAVRDIAATRFNFPGPDTPNFKTFTNRPDRQIGVRLPEGELAFPDIVTVDRDTAVKLLGEVETARSLRETPGAALAEKWTAFSGLGDFYLFVPLSQLDVATRFIKQYRVPVAGLRTWRYIAGQDLIDVTDIP